VKRFALGLVLLGTVIGNARTARAQNVGHDDRSWQEVVAVWISGSLGPGSLAHEDGNPLASALRANVSVGPVLATYRQDIVEPFESGNAVRDNALLVGVRSSGRRVFGSAALGYSEARPYQKCDCFGTADESTVHGMAYDVSAHANLVLFGASLSFSGVAFAPRANYFAATVGLEAGWFGP